MTTLLQKTEGVGAAVARGVRARNADVSGSRYASAATHYDALEAYYDNEAFELYAAILNDYAARYGLYRGTRLIYNPTKRAVDWYPGHVYPGVWTRDGLPSADGSPSAVPFAADVPEALRFAAMQMLGWGNWRSERYVYVRRAAILGDVFVELAADVERRKVYPVLTHPRHLTEIAWNQAGDVTMYAVAIEMRDGATAFRWCKRVDRESVRTWREELGVDREVVEEAHPYGFCPAVWVQHRNVGGQHGAAVIDGVRVKIDEVNHMAASAHDYIGKFQNQGVVLSSESPVKDVMQALTGAGGDDEYGPTGKKRSIRNRLPYFKGPKDLQIHRLIANLGLGEAYQYLTGMLGEIEKDLPEIVMDEQLRAMTGGVTGPGARQMMGDLAGKVAEVQENEDAGLVKTCQMGVAMGGHLVNTGAWGKGQELTDAQRLFLPFGLTSYDRGELAMEMQPRPLVPETPMERTQRAQSREAIQTVQGLREAGYSLEEIYGADGLAALGTNPDGTPKVPGLLDQRQQGASSTADLFERALGAGDL